MPAARSQTRNSSRKLQRRALTNTNPASIYQDAVTQNPEPSSPPASDGTSELQLAWMGKHPQQLRRKERRPGLEFGTVRARARELGITDRRRHQFRALKARVRQELDKKDAEADQALIAKLMTTRD